MQELRGSLELALLKGELQVPAALAQLEQKEKGKFRKLNAQVRDATGVGAAAAAAPEKKSKVVKETVKKALPKDPLKAVKNARKVAKSKPVKKAAPLKNDAVTINLTVNMASATAAVAPTRRKAAAKKAQPKKVPPKVRAKKAASTAQPKPRAEKKPKAGASDPNYFGLTTMQGGMCDEDGDATMADGALEYDDEPRYSDQYDSDEYQWGHNVAY